MKINLPTKITIARIIAVGALIIGLISCWIINLATGWVAPTIPNTGINLIYLIAFVIFIIASLTDMLDGHLARKLNQITTLGKFLDPIADKMLVNSMLLFLCGSWGFAPNQIQIPIFCVVLMVIRDLIVDGMRLIAAQKNVVIAANIFGKLKTIFQMVAIPVVLINGWPFIYFDANWGYGRIALILIYLATLMSIVSGIIYVIQNRNILKGGEDGK